MKDSFLLLKNISKNYKTGNEVQHVLNDVSISFPSKGLIGILGKSGCGKSTLLNLIFKADKPTKGKIYFKNKCLDNISESSYRRNDCSYIFQHYNLIDDFTAYENVLVEAYIYGFKSKVAKKKVDELFENFNLNYLRDKNAKLLSGGEKQRVAILRALISSPSIILCDEPTGALDEENSLAIFSLLKKLSKERLVIVVSHDVDQLNKFADHVISLEDKHINLNLYDNKTSIKISSKFKNFRWKIMFLKSLFKNEKAKNIFLLVLSIFSFILSGLLIGLNLGIENSAKNASKNTLDYGYFTVSKETLISSPNTSVTYHKNIRPNLEEIDELTKEFKTLKICTSLDYVFPSTPNIQINNKYVTDVELIPIYEDTEISSINDVFVNQIFNDKYSSVSSLNISYETTFQTRIDDEIISDDYEFNFDLKIKKVIDEFSFLNSPKIYYSYSLINSYFKREKLPQISEKSLQNTYILDFIENVNNDSKESSYKREIFIEDDLEIDTFISKYLAETTEDIVFESRNYNVSQTYALFTSLVKEILMVSLIIILLISFLLLGIFSFYSFQNRKKDCAILKALGTKQIDLLNIFLNKNLIIVIPSFLISFLVIFIVEKPVENLIGNIFGLYSSININFLLLFLVGILFILLAIFIFVFIPIFITGKIALSKELKDE